ncbi:PQQ-binding-like beta-propeller repeat protein [Streptomyces sp. NPDC017936]|uniref:protein kinase domain-containing protein n=1 Tax=Streptomyces sp. NPDC017936 TaxID=3365016 RepID=UPI0037940BE2
MPLHKDEPRSIGGYRIVDRLGAGGMGVVYRGRARSGREVAVKVVHAQYAEDAVFRARFRQEIEAVRKVSGAFTAPVVDADPQAARPWMATQYVPGRSLAQRIRDEGALRGAELRRLALGLVEALRDIHRAGVVHRDLKPANVLMAEDGPRVIDFGISRAAENNTLTETGQMIGTPPFMSPEQLTDARTVGPASDVFSLGALLVFATTGRGPFDADSPYLTAYRVVHHEPVLDGVAQPLRAVVERCLAKDAGDRPGLDELAREFGRVLPEPAPDDAHTVTLRLPPPVPGESRAPTEADAAPDRPVRRRHPRRLLVLTGAAGVLAVALTLYLVLGPPRDGGTAGAGRPAGPSASSTSSASPTSRWGTLPAGWLPWQTTVYAPAVRGAKPTSRSTGGSPTCLLGGDALYCAGDGILPVRVDPLTGRTAWRAASVPAGAKDDQYDALILGVRGGTVLVRQIITTATGETDTAHLVALDAADGSRLWSRRMNAENADATVVGDLVLTPDTDGRTVTARTARDGAGRWTTTVPSGDYCGFHDIGGRPYADCTTYETGGTRFFALDPEDGTQRPLPSLPDDASYVGALDGSLVFARWGDDEGAADTPYTSVLFVDPDTGARRTTKLAREFRGTVAALVDGTLAFVTSSGQVTAVSPVTGEQLWQTPTTLEQPGEPVADEKGRTFYLASASGRVAALDARAGTLLWESYPRADHVVSGGLPLPTVFAHRGALVVATPDGTVFSVDPAHPERRPASG